MKMADLTPSEKLLCAIFGWPSQPGEVRHWLSVEGEKALNDVLQHWESNAKWPSLREKGVRVIRLRFGFEPRTEAEKIKPHLSDCRTLDEVKVYFGVTRERIRQIEGKVLRQLRHPAYANRSKPYLTGRVV